MDYRQESASFIYDDKGIRQFLVIGNGNLELYRISPATADDLAEVIKAKEV